MVKALEGRKEPEINPFDIVNDAKETKDTLRINFSAAC
jgi:hypothetical protein